MQKITHGETVQAYCFHSKLHFCLPHQCPGTQMPFHALDSTVQCLLEMACLSSRSQETASSGETLAHFILFYFWHSYFLDLFILGCCVQHSLCSLPAPGLENCHGVSPSLSVAPSLSTTTCTEHLPALVSMLHTSAPIPVPGEGLLRVITQVSGPGHGAAGPEEGEQNTGLFIILWVHWFFWLCCHSG